MHHLVLSIILLLNVVGAQLDLESRVLHYDTIQKYASELGFPPQITAIIQIRETGWLPRNKRVNAVSPVGAIGLQQVMPYHSKENLYDPVVNIKVSSRIIRDHYVYYKKDVERVFAAYNGGRGQANKPQDKMCKETRNYVKLAMLEWNKLKGVY